MAGKQQEHWSSDAYQKSASFVPKLAGKVIGWLDVQPDDQILDIGCGDGVINIELARVLAKGTGKIHGIDASEAMIAAAKKAVEGNAQIESACTFEVLDATKISQSPSLTAGSYNKIFSNAAMHWILRPSLTRIPFFRAIHSLLSPSGTFVFEMGGRGNVAEMRAAMLLAVSKRIPLPQAQEAEPFFFPDCEWMTDMLENQVGGFKVEKMELEYRPTKANDVAGWVRLMGKQIFDVLGEGEEREEAEREAIGVLESVCTSPSGVSYIGYVRLRAIVRKI